MDLNFKKSVLYFLWIVNFLTGSFVDTVFSNLFLLFSFMIRVMTLKSELSLHHHSQAATKRKIKLRQGTEGEIFHSEQNRRQIIPVSILKELYF